MGVRVADFCWAGVGAMATRLLADMGAEVIKIEDATRLDITRTLPIYKGQPARPYGRPLAGADPNASGMFNNYNRNKLGVTIDMGTAAGRHLAERLVEQCDVVTENFAPGVMEKWGLTYERLRQLRSDVIYARMSGFGHTGPYRSYRSYGPIVQAVSGLSHISGLPGEVPSGWGLSYMDNQAAYYNSNAILTALYQRTSSAQSVEIDISAVEVGIGLIGPLMLDVVVNGRSTRADDFPTGNRLPYQEAAPHGVYPALGDDRWIAIAVFGQREWEALVDVMGRPEWASDPRVASQRSRHQNQDFLDEKVGSWTASRDRHELMHMLQRVGVTAAAVQTEEDLIDHDPELAARNLYFELDHPVIGPALFEGIPIHFSGMHPDHWRSAPLLGEDNEYVFKDILGLSDREYAEVTHRPKT